MGFQLLRGLGLRGSEKVWAVLGFRIFACWFWAFLFAVGFGFVAMWGKGSGLGFEGLRGFQIRNKKPRVSYNLNS